MKTYTFRKQISVLLWLLCFSVFCGAADAAPKPLAFLKETYPTEDTYTTGVDPNVLFLLDTGSPMAFSPKGRLPLRASMSVSECADLLAECTYGAGTRPFMTSSLSPWPSEAMLTANVEATARSTLYGGTSATSYGGISRYGRDNDTSNNIIGDLNSYYSPYENRPYYLTFKDRNWAHWNGVSALPAAVSALEDNSTMTASDRTALMAYLPGGAKAGQPVTEPNLVKYLMPNDSRMYQMKLVLWRLLSEENYQLLSRMKIAMATSYQESNYPQTFYADFYKYSPYGATAQFPYGTGPDWATGLSGMSGYYHSVIAYAGIDRTYYEGSAGNRWRQVNRAVLKLPFDYMYKIASDGSHQGTSNLENFRRYINGIEAGDSSSFTDPELFADGKTPLSTAIYGRKDLMNGSSVLWAGENSGSYRHNAIHFETGSGAQRQYYAANSYIPLQDYQIEDEMTNGTLRAGLATGSVIDFFSPGVPAAGGGSVATHFISTFPGTGTGDTRGYYPVIGSCQSNWLVVFTAGNDSDPDAAVDAQQAVSNLYKDTNNNGIIGREWNKTENKWERKLFDMDSGIRTLVVGFVDPNATDQSSVRLRETLTEMAAYGAPYADGSPNYSSKPYFANDVPSLIASLKAVLLRINSDRFASGAPTIMPQAADVVGDASLYSSSYKIEVFDQWEGWFSKYKMISADTLALQWEANDRLLSRGSSRSIYSTNSAPGSSSTAVTTIEAGNLLATRAGIPSAHVSAFSNWLKTYNTQSLLGDMEHSGYAVVASSDRFPTRNKRVYIQTNRGYLHSLEDANGYENWVFIPPNILHYRLKALKFDAGDTWVEGDGTTRINSYPAKLLDGGVVQGDVRDSGSYRTVLVGNMGWGGNGFYAMDVTDSSNTPKFLWAIDNARYGIDAEAVPLADGVYTWGGAVGATAYTDLGLTIVDPVLLSVDQKTSGASRAGDVGLLAGGLGYQLGLNSQGKALYVFEPVTGAALRVIREDGTGFEDPTPGGSRSLGMLIAPITYVADKKGTAKYIYTADSQGNVLFCDATQPVVDWKVKSVFQLLASDGIMPLHIPQALAVGSTTRADWVFGGTSDLMVPDYNANRKMENPEHYIWAHNLTKASGDVTTLDLNKLGYEPDTIVPSYTSTGNIPSNPNNDPNFYGWSLMLRPASATTGREYVTTPPYLYNGVLIVSTFIPKPIPEDMNNKDLCPELGDSKIYALDPITGAGKWDNNSQAQVLRNVKISGISAYNGSLYISIKPLKPGAVNDFSLKGGSAVGEDGNMYRFDPPGDLSSVEINISADIPFIQYWKEAF